MSSLMIRLGFCCVLLSFATATQLHAVTCWYADARDMDEFRGWQGATSQRVVKGTPNYVVLDASTNVTKLHTVGILSIPHVPCDKIRIWARINPGDNLQLKVGVEISVRGGPNVTVPLHSAFTNLQGWSLFENDIARTNGSPIIATDLRFGFTTVKDGSTVPFNGLVEIRGVELDCDDS